MSYTVFLHRYYPQVTVKRITDINPPWLYYVGILYFTFYFARSSLIEKF